MSEGTFNFDVKFNEAVALFEGIEHIEIDDDGVIHAYMASGEVVDYNQIKDLFELSGGIIFKGIINSASELPASHLTGWMYMIGTAGRYISQVCEPGDIIICIADGEVSSDADWTIVQTNLNPNLFAPITSPEFQGTISLGRKSGTTKGSSSVAVGSNVEASAYASHAEGHNTKATADHAHAEGYWTTASGEDSHAEGNTTTASGRYSHAEGVVVTASGEASHAEGSNTKASGHSSHAEGVGTIANHYSQHAGGEFNVADPSSETSGNRGDYVEIIGNGVSTVSRSNARSLDWNGNERLAGDVYINCNDDSTGGTALGAEVAGVKSSIGTVPSGKTLQEQIDAKADKDNTVLTSSLSMGRKSSGTVGANSNAIGYNVEASGDYSHAEGYQTIANHNSQHVFGHYNVADTSTNPPANRGSFVEIVGVGTGTSNRSNGRTLDWGGNERLKGDLYVHSTTGLDGKKVATEENPVFTGSISLGRKANTTIGERSFAVGNNVQATDYNCHAEGYGTIASGYTSHAEGYSTTSSGQFSHAEGKQTQATNDGAHAEGNLTQATGKYSHAEGNETFANGNYSHSEGMYTIANGVCSHAEGEGTTASGDYQHVSGKYNATDSTSFEIVGNGTGTNARKNVRLLDVNGNEKLKGDIYVGCNDDSTGGTALGAEVASIKSSIGTVPSGETVEGQIADIESSIGTVPSGETVEGQISTLDSNKAPKASPVFTGTPTAPTPTAGDNSQKIATTAFVMNAFTENDAMLYKGVVNANTDLPATHKVGWTYKVGTAGSYAGKTCEVGDMIICNTDGTAATDAHWDVIQTNINGAVTGPASATNNRIALFDGTTGKIIKQSSYTAGAAAAKGVDTSFSNTSSANLPTTAAVAEQLALKANVANPVFTGSISLGRAENTEVGEKSVAIGNNVEAISKNDFATGVGTKATAYNERVFGAYNVMSVIPWTPNTYYEKDFPATYNGSIYTCFTPHTSGDSFNSSYWSENSEYKSALEIVGNGNSAMFSGNARRLDWNGNEYLAGDLYVKCDYDSSDGKKVATEETVMGIFNHATQYTPSNDATFDYGTWYHEVGTSYIARLNDSHAPADPELVSVWQVMGDAPYHIPSSSDSDWLVYTFADAMEHINDFQNNIADIFYSGVVYEEGRYVTRDGVTYKRKSWGNTTPVAKAWSASDWEKVDVANDLNDKIDSKFDAVNEVIGEVPSETTVEEQISDIEEQIEAVEDSIGTVPTGHTVMEEISVIDKKIDSKADDISETDATPAAIKSFTTDIKDKPICLSVAIEPVQSGSGNPSPSNVRPITGWTGVEITVSPTDNPDDPNKTEYTVTFPSSIGTVYGGTLTVNKDGTGNLVVTHAMLTVDGSLTPSSINTNGNRTAFRVSHPNCPYWVRKGETKITGAISNRAVEFAQVGGHNPSELSQEGMFALSSSYGGSRQIGISITSMATTAEMIQSYMDTYPLTICYPLKDASEYPLTCEQVKTLLGINNLWADTGDILSVDYPVDTKNYIDGKIGTVNESIGTVPSGTTVEGQISNLRESLIYEYTDADSALWDFGTISASSGSNSSSNYAIRTKDYLTKNIRKIKTINNYKYHIFAYGTNNSYVGNYNGTTFVTSATEWITEPTDMTLLPSEYSYRITLAKENDDSIDLTDRINCIFESYTDPLVQIAGIPADAAGVRSLMAPKRDPEFLGSISLERTGTVGFGSMSVGFACTASGEYSQALGYQTKATVNYAYAEGEWSKATAKGSHAEGYKTTANGQYSHAEGYQTTTSNTYSHAEGDHATASGDSSHAEGYYTTASGDYSHAEGYRTTTSGSYAHAEGEGTVANHRSQHVFGEYNNEDQSTETADSLGNYIEIVGNGTYTSDRSNARVLDWNGNERLKGDIYVNCNADSTGGSIVATKAYVDNLFSSLVNATGVSF